MCRAFTIKKNFVIFRSYTGRQIEGRISSSKQISKELCNRDNTFQEKFFENHVLFCTWHNYISTYSECCISKKKTNFVVFQDYQD